MNKSTLEIRPSRNKKYIKAVTEALYEFQSINCHGHKLRGRVVVDEDNLPDEGIFAFIDNTLVGGLTYTVCNNEWVFLNCGYVWKEHRGQGIYRAILHTLEDAIRKQNLSGMMCSTYEWEAPGVYEKMGFTRGAVLRNCPDGNTSIDYFKDIKEEHTRSGKIGYDCVSGKEGRPRHPSFDELQRAAMPLLTLLNEYYDPHHYAVVTEGGVEILGGQMCAPLPVRD